jgi:hypothetical protein
MFRDLVRGYALVKPFRIQVYPPGPLDTPEGHACLLEQKFVRKLREYAEAQQGLYVDDTLVAIRKNDLDSIIGQTGHRSDLW